MALVLVTRSATAPAHPYDGQVWVDLSGPIPSLKVYDAGNTSWLAQDETADLTNIVGTEPLDTTATTLIGAINEAFATAGGGFETSGTVLGTMEIDQHGVNVPVGDNAPVACSVGAPAAGDHFIVVSGSEQAHTITTINGAPFVGMGAGMSAGKLVATFSGALTDKLECVKGMADNWQVITASGVTFTVDPV